MQRDIFDAEHDAFRDLARTFIAKEITPFHDQWERDGQVSRDVWRAAGRAGLLGSLAYVEELDQPVLRAVTLDTLVETTKTWPAGTTLLLDSTDPSRRGAGRAAVDWPRAAVITRGRRVVLAGGLTPDNIEEAIATVRPMGVDVASGVESAPGVKDLDQVTRFLTNARRAFARMVNP